MSTLDAFILGILQGFTEFLPISSSGHLALGQILLGMKSPEENLFLNVMLHVGTVGAIIIVYRKDLFEMLRNPDRRIGYILLGTIPAGILGLMLKSTLADLTVVTWAVGIGFLVTSLVLLFVERDTVATEQQSLVESGMGVILFIGFAQALALMPGVSRSGMTIAAALLAGMVRSDAVRFSFLLAIPVILGGAVLELREISQFSGTFQPIPVLAGMVTACAVGVASLRILTAVVREKRLVIFSIYCATLGAATLIWGTHVA